ncbi:MAG: 2-amino-4-hydroxy-6-hydroxymethyldihydropteridine diphosphokinase [Crocinitomicaceae bacterium]|nr:2-amino-4-hydroxy-6-hydroxymethyldihydropteridine diphosphokinase [Crocinitomicaceae bacterium]MDC0100367.1 2-amino-4-hydroxy-6-hydroxymethyldihydropteridine diphosphokinase [Crocinitomicaceae bacterium]|tara:strand:+ start:3570 stop:4067 length:498 start_codon:yes stop_codon:yes gene_type:complete
MESIAYLSIGTNLGNRVKNIEDSIELIKSEAGTLIAKSSIYTSEPVGFSAETDFLNLCISIRTILSPLELLEKLKNIEFQLGRKKKSENGVYQSRLIDIDIIFYDDLILSTKKLSIPHERYHQRMFVLKPLSQIAANFLDPVQGKRIKQVFNECMDQSTIHLHDH